MEYVDLWTIRQFVSLPVCQCVSNQMSKFLRTMCLCLCFRSSLPSSNFFFFFNCLFVNLCRSHAKCTETSRCDMGYAMHNNLLSQQCVCVYTWSTSTKISFQRASKRNYETRERESMYSFDSRKIFTSFGHLPFRCRSRELEADLVRFI